MEKGQNLKPEGLLLPVHGLVPCSWPQRDASVSALQTFLGLGVFRLSFGGPGLETQPCSSFQPLPPHTHTQKEAKNCFTSRKHGSVHQEGSPLSRLHSNSV